MSVYTLADLAGGWLRRAPPSGCRPRRPQRPPIDAANRPGGQGAALFNRPSATPQALHFSTGVHSRELLRKRRRRLWYNGCVPAPVVNERSAVGARSFTVRPLSQPIIVKSLALQQDALFPFCLRCCCRRRWRARRSWLTTTTVIRPTRRPAPGPPASARATRVAPTASLTPATPPRPRGPAL